MRSINHFIHKTTTLIVLLSLTLSAIQVPTTAVSAQGQDDGIVREFNSDTGKVTLLTGANDQPVAMLSAMSMDMTDQQRADVLVQSFAPEFGVTNPRADLEMMAQSQPAGNRVTTKYQQTYKGVPVMAGELIVNASEQGALYSMNGEVAQALSLDTTPTLTADEAVASAKQGMVKWYGGKEADYKQTQAELWIFDESLLRPSIRPAELVWRVEMIPVDEGQPIRELVLVNAETGNVPLHFNQIDTSWNAVDVPQQETEPTVTPTPTEIPTEVPVVAETPTPSVTPIPDEIQPTPTPETLPTEVPGELNALAIATYYVNGATGSDSNSCTTVALPCQHIQQAIEKGSTAGDTIKVAGGTYTWSDSALHPGWKNVVIMDRSLTLSGGWNADFTAQNSASIIDGEYNGTNNGSIGVLARSGTVIVENFIVQNSYGGGDGGGIYIYQSNFTLKNSTLKNNISTSKGAGIYSHEGTLTVINSTISGNGNSGTTYGGGIYANNGTATITNSTIAYNTAANGGGITRNTGTYVIKNTIIANNTAPTGLDCSGVIATSSYNIIGNTTGCTITAGAGDQFNVDPLIDSLLTGTMQTHALQTGSPAINTGTAVGCPDTDENSIPRPQGNVCDIGSVEKIGTKTIYILNGSNQTTVVDTAFTLPLKVYAQNENFQPASGIEVTFTAPETGASGTFSSTNTNTITVTTNASGIAESSILTANNTVGANIVTVTATGYLAAQFELINKDNPSLDPKGRFVSPTGSDSTACNSSASPCLTINKAIQSAVVGDKIYVEAGTYTGTSAEVVLINKGVTLIGGWKSGFTTQNGVTILNGQGVKVNSGITAGLEWLVVQNSGSNNSTGLTNNGTLTLNNITVSHNMRQGITNNGIMVLNNSTVSGNAWGGIYNSSTLTLNSSTVSGNVGGGIYNSSTLTLNNSTVSGNIAVDAAGGGINSNSGTTTLNNSTISGNKARTGGGIYKDSGTVTIKNTLIAGNSAIVDGPDCAGYIKSAGNNLIGNTTGCTYTPVTGDQINVNPNLGRLIGNPGYYPLQAGSPAINAGSPATCLPTDQRGAHRVGRCDIGAYEYTTPGSAAFFGYSSGSQRANPGTVFYNPLVVYVTDGQGTPVSGEVITFTAPASGVSGIFTDSGTNITTAVSNSNGLAITSAFTANSQKGSYSVTAASSGLSGTATFSLTNDSWYVALTGSDSNSCTPAAPCGTILGVLGKGDFAPGDMIKMSDGLYYMNGTLIKDVNISGGWNSDFTDQSGDTRIRNSTIVNPNVTAKIEDINFTGLGFYRSIDNSGNLTMNRVAIYNNSAGGIYQNGGNLILNNVTISNNTIKVGPSSSEILSGGGIYIKDGSVSINNSTITQNAVFDQEDYSRGGGIANPNNRPLTITNSIIAGNISKNGQDCFGTMTSGGHNLIGNSHGCGFTRQPGDQVGTQDLGINPMLGNIQDNGGPTFTHTLLTGSSAINAGDPLTCASTDQRGTPRPQGYACDIGAFEGSTAQMVSGLIRTYNSNNSNDNALPGFLECTETTTNCLNMSLDFHVGGAHEIAIGVYEFYLAKHNRLSFDNSNGPIISTVRYGSHYPDSFWNGMQIVYGDHYNLPLADDNVAHEFTHAVTQYESGLVSFYQSGAINEALSDLWGEYYDQVGNYDPVGDTEADKWLFGEDAITVGTGGFRSMSDPTQYGDPDKMSSPLYEEGNADSGHIHSNNGINNKAVFLMVDGAAFNGFTVTGIGWDKTAAIYYEVQTNLLSSGADYSDLYYAVQQACTNLSLSSYKGVTSADCVQVKKALDAVEMNKQPAAFVHVDAPACPAGDSTGTVLNIFSDNLENGTANWAVDNKWFLGDFFASSPIHHLYGDDYYPNTTSTLQLRHAITLPAGTSYLYFKHAFGFEYGSYGFYDGAVLEYSIDNGLTWKDAKPLFSAGQNYTGTIYPNWINPLKGRSGFVGDSHGYVSSRYNLTSLAGKAVKFQWKFATDDIYSSLGWMVDDIKIYTCMGSPSIPAYTAPADKALSTNYKPLLDWTDATPNIHHYQVQVATDSAFTAPLYDVNNIVTSQYPIPTDLPSNTTYYWRVRAFNILDETKGWTAARTFRTALTPPVLTPLTLPITNNRPTFDWSDVLDTTNYTLQVSTSNTFATFAVNVTVNGSNYTPTVDLPANKSVLWWRVSSNGTNGPSAWATSSTSFSTTNPPSVPVLAAPVDKALTTDYTPKLDWNNSTVPLLVFFDHYRVQIATDASFSTLVDDHDVTGISNSDYTPSLDLPANTTYYWRVSSYNQSEQRSAWSLVRSFRTALPKPTTLLLPANNQLSTLNRPLFDWDDVPGATGYTIQISTVSTFASTLVKTDTVASTFTPTVDLPANKPLLYWRVIANGVNGPSLPSDYFTFSTANPPPIPMLSAPVDNLLITNTLPPKLDWANVTVPATIIFGGYQLQVATDAAFSSVILTQAVIGGPTISDFTLPSLLLSPNTKYYWRVRSFDSTSHYSSWSLTRSFRMVMPAPTLLLPVNGEVALQPNRPTFDWDDVIGATGYTIQISTVSTFASTLVKTDTVASTFTPTIDLPANKPLLYWRVITNGANGPSLPSGFFTFSTANPPPIPVLSAPVDNLLITNNLPPKLDWANVTVPATIVFGGYQLQVATDTAFSSVILTQPVIGGPTISDFTLPSLLLSPNTKYYWRVRSFDSTSHYSSWSLVRSFRMVMPAPTTLTLPGDGTTLQTIRPTFDWEDAPGATGYTIQISAVNTFASFVLNTSAAGSTYTPATDLPANKLLFWRVIANGPNGPSAPSASHSFTTGTPPPSIPVLSAPVDNLLITDTLTPKLDWANSTVPAGVTFGKYQLEVATDLAFSSVVLTQDVTGGLTVSESTLTAPLSPNTKYYWHVRSVNSLGHFSGWSLTRSFRIAVVAPTLTSPAGPLTTADLTPVFDWDDVSGASYYSIQISTTNTFTTTLVNTTAPASTYTPTVDLPANTALYWRVLAQGPNGPGKWSAYTTFIMQ